MQDIILSEEQFLALINGEAVHYQGSEGNANIILTTIGKERLLYYIDRMIESMDHGTPRTEIVPFQKVLDEVNARGENPL